MVMAKGLDHVNHEILPCKTFIRNKKHLEENPMGDYQIYRDQHGSGNVDNTMSYIYVPTCSNLHWHLL